MAVSGTDLSASIGIWAYVYLIEGWYDYYDGIDEMMCFIASESLFLLFFTCGFGKIRPLIMEYSVCGGLLNEKL